jgi:hypothetical protein
MKRPQVLFQVAALVSSGLLAGGFVSYQAGAFNRLTAPREQPADPPSTPAVQEKPPDAGTPTRPAIMSSSKSMIIHVAPPTADTPQPQPPAATELSPPATPKPMPIVIPSPKSGPIFTPPAATNKPEPPPAPPNR